MNSIAASTGNATPAQVDKPHGTGVRHTLAWLSREPLLHFVLLGGLLFAVSEYLEARSNFSLITVSKAQVQGIADNYRLQYGVAPSAAELNALVDNAIKEEVFYHEALRLNLDKDDEIIRRRLVQKYEFLQQDLGTVRTPEEADLQAFYHAHAVNYRVPAKLSFTQVFFSQDVQGEQPARQRALTVLQQLNASDVGRAPELGDRFPGLSDYAAVTATQVGRIFGDHGLAQALFNGSAESLPVNQWQGPYHSAYGWHLVYVSAREAETTAPYAQVRDTVLRDYTEDQRGIQNAAALAKLKQSFTIVRE